MESPREGQLVSVADNGSRAVDGIVFQVASHLKVVVAVPDPARGAVLRTFPAKALSEREAASPADPALERLIRRTPATQRGGKHAGGAGSHGRASFARGVAHRPTGK